MISMTLGNPIGERTEMTGTHNALIIINQDTTTKTVQIRGLVHVPLGKNQTNTEGIGSRNQAIIVQT